MTWHGARARRSAAGAAAGVCLACALALGAAGGLAEARASVPGPGYGSSDEAPGFVPGASGGLEEPSAQAADEAPGEAAGAEGAAGAGASAAGGEAPGAAPGAGDGDGGAAADGGSASGGAAADGGSAAGAGTGANAGANGAAEASGRVGVGPWYAQFDAAAVQRAGEAVEAARFEHASLQAGLAAGFLASVALVCAAAGAACLIAARARGQGGDRLAGAMGARRPRAEAAGRREGISAMTGRRKSDV